jgi:xanthine dehydrogenase molybdopterin-binding subunit B
MAIPAKLSQKINRPVMMRITREEEFTIGGARQGFQGWIKVGFKPDGVMSACDLYIISDNGGKGGAATLRRLQIVLTCCISPMRCASAVPQ